MREKARRSRLLLRRMARRIGGIWHSRNGISIGSRRKAKIVQVKRKVRLGVAEDELLPGRSLSRRPAGGARIRRIKLQKLIPYVPRLRRRSGNLSAGRRVKVLRLFERILVKRRGIRVVIKIELRLWRTTCRAITRRGGRRENNRIILDVGPGVLVDIGYAVMHSVSDKGRDR